MEPLLDLVLEKIPGPRVAMNGPLQMLVTTLDWSDYVGRIAIGRIESGRLTKGAPVVRSTASGELLPAKIVGLQVFDKLGRVDAEEATAGDIAAISGVENVEIGDTICDPADPRPLERLSVDEPTLSMVFGVNSSPLAGRCGKYLTTRHIRDRLMKELEKNVALRVEPIEGSEQFSVSGRGLLHLSVLIETMRREGYEVMVSMPRVIVRESEQGPEEPYEDVTIDCEEAYSGTVIQELNERGGEMLDLRNGEDGTTRLEYRIPSRGLIGYRSLFLTQTRGTGTLYSTFSGYGPLKGAFKRRSNGVLVAMEAGQVTGYALETLQERGTLFVEPGDQVYSGQVVGENSRQGDMVVNPCKAKKLDNMRSATKEIDVRLNVPRKHALEEALEYINDDELVEVTPTAIRLRKRLLDHNERRRLEKIAEG
jgi:GTP-binding protein